jgi:hypothetical protein
MQLRNNAVPSPSFRAVAEIAQYAGRGRTVGHFATVRFPGGAVQVWALTPHTWASSPDADAASTVVAVFLKGRGIDRWKPLDQGFEAAVAHYQRLAAARRRADDTIRMPADAGGAPAATA